MQKASLTKHQEQISMFGDKMLREKMLNILEAFLLESIGTQQATAADISLFDQLRYATFQLNRKKYVHLEVLPCKLESITQNIKKTFLQA